MNKRLCASLLFMLMLFFSVPLAYSAARGPAFTFDELQDLLSTAHEGDVITIADDIFCEKPLTSSVSVRITSHSETSSLHGLHLQDAQISFSNIHLKDSLVILGDSDIHLHSGTHVSGADGNSGVYFSGCGLFLADRGSSITGGKDACGVSIRHDGGEFFTNLEGIVTGGSGSVGGTGVLISPLRSSGAIMLSGSITGGPGEALGGHAVDLYNLSGNAFVTIDGCIKGGDGAIGGDGIQLVSVCDIVNIGITGKVIGGTGDSYGGDAIMLMDAYGASVIHLSGEFVGGDAKGSSSQPGTSLVMVGDSTSARAHVNNCLLLDGSRILNAEYAAPQVTPLPGISSSAKVISTFEDAPRP